VVVVDAASPRPSRSAQQYRATFLKLGAAEVHTPRLNSREDADESRFLEIITAADLVYFSGGDQSRLVGIMRGTQSHECLLTRHAEEGVLIAGTSAGAAALSAQMISRGESDLWPRKGFVRLAPGLGFTELVIDQHFSQRGRSGRLVEALTIMSDHDVCGVGVDENTALILSPDGSGEVVGEGGVAMVRLGNGDETAWHRVQPGEIVSLPRAEITILRHGDRVGNVCAWAMAARREG
jgi:cyanophycinase